MTQKSSISTVLSAVFIALGLFSIGLLLKNAILDFKAMDRTVVVKGLDEQIVAADTAIWPIKFTKAGNHLEEVVATVEKQQNAVVAFLTLHGFSEEEVGVGQLSVVDKLAQEYGSDNSKFRYLVSANLSVYSKDPEKVRRGAAKISELAKQGIVIASNRYETRIQYLFNGLNDIKPKMIEKATHNAREVALKFAHDSDSSLGKIRSARQGQFSINDRDSNTPYLKKVRVVSTIEYYLTD